MQLPKSKYYTLNPLIQAPYFNLSALSEISPLSLDKKKLKQKSTKSGPIPYLKIHRYKNTQGE